MTLQNAFHFDSLVWGGSVALSLFLLGISAGSAILAVLLHRRGVGHQSGILKATAILAPLSLLLALLMLICSLTRPWTFWKLMFHYQFGSMMSMASLLFQLYLVVLLAWLAVVFRAEIEGWRSQRFGDKYARLDTLIGKLVPYERWLNPLLLLLALWVGLCTGLILAGLKNYPMLNSPVLPILLLVTGFGSGIAATTLLAVTRFNESHQSKAFCLVQRLRRPVVIAEICLLLLFFGSLYLSGGQQLVAMLAAIGGGFWSLVFWCGVIGLGIVLPQVLSTLGSPEQQHGTPKLVLHSSLTLVGILLLGYVILYAGQMTVL
ncbi:NrfD/PsrC family molybdoenzyme membrane anchor subunit [Aeromonas sp. MdU4]|uniref:NrfD/PsrC family molybdoenzyme membrane anchor subunit n=1 Tax=Aeromonas sp. MdU4 TaxID=3342819 RepID=UPI0035B99687